LLLELRPTSLFDTDLVDLITHLVNAFIARTRLEVNYSKEIDGNPPSYVNEVFFRVAQEAFNNIVKHADATEVNVILKCQPAKVELMVEDNGCGFNPDEVSPDHLGVGIMHERAGEINADLIINSKQYHGTVVHLIWSDEKLEKNND
jgi:signal transduction histidine kinase